MACNPIPNPDFRGMNNLMQISHQAGSPTLKTNIQALFHKLTSLCEEQTTELAWYPYPQWPSAVPPGQHKTNAHSLHYLCCSHDCSCGCNIQPLSAKMHQCVIAFVLRLADVVINVLKQVQKTNKLTGIECNQQMHFSLI